MFSRLVFDAFLVYWRQGMSAAALGSQLLLTVADVLPMVAAHRAFPDDDERAWECYEVAGSLAGEGRES